MKKIKILLTKTYSKFTIRICFVTASACMLIGNVLALNVWGIIASGLFLSGNTLAFIDYIKK